MKVHLRLYRSLKSYIVAWQLLQVLISTNSSLLQKNWVHCREAWWVLQTFKTKCSAKLETLIILRQTVFLFGMLFRNFLNCSRWSCFNLRKTTFPRNFRHRVDRCTPSLEHSVEDVFPQEGPGTYFKMCLFVFVILPEVWLDFCLYLFNCMFVFIWFIKKNS